MQKDVIHNDPLEDEAENRKPGVGVVVRIPFRNAEEPENS